jgi:hypothetical protein
MEGLNYSINSYQSASADIKNNIFMTIISDSTFDYLIDDEQHNDIINDNIITLIKDDNIYNIRLLSKSGSTLTEILNNNNDKLIDIKNNINSYYYVPLQNSMKLELEYDLLAGILQNNKLKHIAIELPTIMTYNNEFIHKYNKELYSRYELDENKKLEIDHYHMCTEGIIFVLYKYLSLIKKPNSLIISIGWNSYNDFDFNELNTELNNISNFITL